MKKKIIIITILLVLCCTICISFAKENPNIKNVQASSEKLLKKGMKYSKAKQYTKALKMYEKAVSINQTDKTYYMLASAYSELKDHDNAIKYYTKAIELNPKMVNAYLGRAKDCGDKGDYKCSLENFEALKKMFPEKPYFYWATSLYKSNTKNLIGAMKDIDKAISMINEPNATYYAQKAWIYFYENDSDNCFKYLRKALEINPDDGYALGLFMYAAYNNKDYEEVIKTAEKLINCDESSKYNHALYSTYAKALYKKGYKEKALQNIDYALELEPKNKKYQQYKEKMLSNDFSDK